MDLSRPQRIRRPAISDDYEIYNSKEIQMEDYPTSFEEAMRSVNSSKWTAAVDDCKVRNMSISYTHKRRKTIPLTHIFVSLT